ncbi:hypothetical protein, partial [Sphaerotilus montanus]|uniref:hypothetical protein n=1 Tax=Sphaerotilus montanus TaxID=522889 RepID=UPI001C5C9EFA
ASTAGSTCAGWWLGSSSMSRGASLGLSGSFGGMLRIVANQVFLLLQSILSSALVPLKMCYK